MALGVGEQRDPFGGGAERDAVAGQAGADRRARSRGGSCRCRAGRAGRRSPCRRGSRAGRGAGRVSRCSERLEGEVELLERLARREPRGLDPGLAAVAVAAVGLGLQQRGGELLIAPFLGAGAVGELGQRPRGGRRLELRGTGARARSSARSCDQRVVAGQRPDLDRRLARRRRGRRAARGRARAR